MQEELKDRYGRIVAYIKEEYNKKVIYNKLWKRLAYYDGRCTYDNLGRMIGYGNFLVLFIKDEIQI